MKCAAILDKDDNLIAFVVMDRPQVTVDKTAKIGGMGRPILTPGQSLVEVDLKPDSLELGPEEFTTHVHAVAKAKLQEAKQKK